MTTATPEPIETQPLTLPRDAKPSELVRSLAWEHWRRNGTKRLMPDGQMQWCAAGILLEHMGCAWDSGQLELLKDDGSLLVTTEFRPFTDAWLQLASILNRSESQDKGRLRSLTMLNDERGKDAAADYLESLGL